MERDGRWSAGAVPPALQERDNRGIISADRARVRVGESILAELGKLPGVGAGVGAVSGFLGRKDDGCGKT